MLNPKYDWEETHLNLSLYLQHNNIVTCKFKIGLLLFLNTRLKEKIYLVT